MAEPSDGAVELTQRECWEHLRSEAYGRLAVVDEDGPAIYPVNVLVDHATLVFRTTEGTKLDALRADPRVAFEVDGFDAESGNSWSVAIRGEAGEILVPREAVEVMELDVTPWQAGPKPVVVRIVPNAVTGRRFRRSGAR
jgi:nitroimidazol reductase NimA-like FMN-containing flavoprotein (pyridoxamine 5'-phosphate oxidase superfamily)